MRGIKLGWYKVFDESTPFKVVHIREDGATFPILGHYKTGSSNAFSHAYFTGTATWIGEELGKWIPFKDCNLKATDFAVKARGCNNFNGLWIEGTLTGINCHSNRYCIENKGWFKHCEIWEPLL